MTVLKWHGGKTYLAKRIIELMPEHTHYAEPFFGGGAVLFAKNPNGVSETVNDINMELMNFWNVIRGGLTFPAFCLQANLTPLTEVFWKNVEILKSPSIFTADHEIWTDKERNMLELHSAMKFFIRYRQSRQALGKDYVTPTRRTRRGMNEQVSAWLSAVEGLPEAHERLIRVEIRNMDAIEFIRKYDHKDCLFYCDPPYLHETRVTNSDYQYEMSPEQHTQLLMKLKKIKGKFILSGYRHIIYDAIAAANNWRRVDIEIDNKASSQFTKPIKTECLWMNY